ncbi:hypothetical protein LSH36_660g01028 [Paralvinella palmiformis]|uniref:Uncharacterized protein n=1 Tax=Paralvinella palmiformis TaxID=53620 RepID=A0AAD9J507_9ANNE|nr:hypothetical protein LSH36_660g01028 [Paralvinella palmiformis]
MKSRIDQKKMEDNTDETFLRIRRKTKDSNNSGLFLGDRRKQKQLIISFLLTDFRSLSNWRRFELRERLPGRRFLCLLSRTPPPSHLDAVLTRPGRRDGVEEIGRFLRLDSSPAVGRCGAGVGRESDDVRLSRQSTEDHSTGFGRAASSVKEVFQYFNGSDLIWLIHKLGFGEGRTTGITTGLESSERRSCVRRAETPTARDLAVEERIKPLTAKQWDLIRGSSNGAGR